MGSIGADRNAPSTSANVENAIKNIEKNPIEVSKAEVDDIKTSSYGFDTSKLSDADKVKFTELTGKEADGVVQVKLGGMSNAQLKDIIRLASTIRTHASTFAMEDAFKLLSYNRKK